MKVYKKLGAFLATCAMALGGVVLQSQASWADDNTEVVYVWQKLDYGNKQGLEETFTYCIEAEQEGAPMPSGGVTGSPYCWTMTGSLEGDDKLTLDFSDAFDKMNEREHTYRMYQKIDTPVDGYTYDSTVWRVLVHKVGRALIIYNEDNEKVTDPGWTVKYEDKATPPPATGTGGDGNPSSPLTPPSTTTDVPTQTILSNTGARIGLGAFVVAMVAGGILLIVRRRAVQDATSEA
ncbi:MAG: hypothetical protein J6M18_00745 [Actinomycetaceae bacterium]|nr:hypothetical protein [Actinomycetaceae bacterium]